MVSSKIFYHYVTKVCGDHTADWDGHAKKPLRLRIYIYIFFYILLATSLQVQTQSFYNMNQRVTAGLHKSFINLKIQAKLT
jgi:hypothetical protein